MRGENFYIYEYYRVRALSGAQQSLMNFIVVRISPLRARYFVALVKINEKYIKVFFSAERHKNSRQMIA